MTATGDEVELATLYPSEPTAECREGIRRERFRDIEITVVDSNVISERDLGGCDLARVYAPSTKVIPEFAAREFVWKPTRIVWLLSVPGSDADYFAALSRRGREDVRRSLRYVSEHFSVVLEPDLQPATLRQWLELYAEQIGSRRHGVPYALRRRDELNDPNRFAGAFLLDGDRLVGGAVAEKLHDAKRLHITYYASNRGQGDSAGVGRALYVFLIRLARSLGFEQVTLGADSNLYGHHLSVGLYLFKLSLRFVPVSPAQLGLPELNILERVMSLEKLENPSFCLGYSCPEAISLDVGHVFTALPHVDDRHFNPKFLDRLERNPGFVDRLEHHFVPIASKRGR